MFRTSIEELGEDMDWIFDWDSWDKKDDNNNDND